MTENALLPLVLYHFPHVMEQIETSLTLSSRFFCRSPVILFSLSDLQNYPPKSPHEIRWRQGHFGHSKFYPAVKTGKFPSLYDLSLLNHSLLRQNLAPLVESRVRAEAEQQQEGVSVIIHQIGCDDVGPTFKARWGPEAFGFGIGLHSVWCGVFSGGCCLIVNFCVSKYQLWSGVERSGWTIIFFFFFGWGPSSLFE